MGRDDRAVDRSLLKTRAHLADQSRRSRLCWLQLLPVLLATSLLHYSSARRIDEFLVQLGDTGFVGVAVVGHYPQPELQISTGEQ